jgi:hypothetical protein
MLVGSQCVAPNTACGTGTHDQNGTCVPDHPMQTAYEIRVAPKIAADGGTANEVFAFGTQPDGSPATDVVVLNTDRSGAGAYDHPQVTLGTMGARVSFVGCAQSVPGCTGPLALTMALANAPTVPIASVATELVDPASIDPARACLAGGNMMQVTGNDQLYNGSTTITNATFTQSFASDLYEVDVSPADPAQGGPWKLIFSSQTFGFGLGVDHYPHAQRWYPTYGQMQPLQPAMLVSNTGACDTITGEFTIETLTPNPNPTSFTATFVQHCNGSTTTAVTGCVHVGP